MTWLILALVPEELYKLLFYIPNFLVPSSCTEIIVFMSKMSKTLKVAFVKISSQMYCCIPLIPSLRWQQQVGPFVTRPVWYTWFQLSQAYIVNCFRKWEKKEFKYIKKSKSVCYNQIPRFFYQFLWWLIWQFMNKRPILIWP